MYRSLIIVLLGLIVIYFMIDDSPVFYPSHDLKKSNAPFSEAVQVGNTFYLSGQIGRNPETRALAEGGIQPQTAQTIKNIAAVLNHHGMDLQNVVKATVILDNIDDFKAFNEVYSKYFTQKPARTTFAAAGLAVGAKIEIEVVAVK